MTEEKKLDWDAIEKKSFPESENREKKNYLRTSEFVEGEEYIYQLLSFEQGIKTDYWENGFRFMLIGEDGEEYTFETNSQPIFYGFKGANLQIGDWFKIVRTGQMKETRYKMDKIEG